MTPGMPPRIVPNSIIEPASFPLVYLVILSLSRSEGSIRHSVAALLNASIAFGAVTTPRCSAFLRMISICQCGMLVLRGVSTFNKDSARFLGTGRRRGRRRASQIIRRGGSSHRTQLGVRCFCIASFPLTITRPKSAALRIVNLTGPRRGSGSRSANVGGGTHAFWWGPAIETQLAEYPPTSRSALFTV